MPSRTKLLILEDDPLDAALLVKRLAGLGFLETTVAPDSAEAFRALENNHFDLALLDIVLAGGEDGVETGRIMQQEYGLPVVFITNYSDEKTIDRAKQIAPYGYLVKPITKAGLSTTLEVALNRSLMDERLKSAYRELEAANQALTREVEEHQKTLAAALESENRWRTMTDIGPDAIFILDGQGRFLYVNSIAAALFHRPAAELIGRGEAEFLPPEITEPHLELIKRVLGERVPMNVEETLPLPAGELSFDTRLVPLLDQDGRPYAVLGVSRGITERYQVQKNLRELTSTLEEKVRERTYNLEVLGGLSRELGFAPNYDEFFRMMMTPLDEVMEHDVAASLVRSGGGFNLYIKNSRPVSDKVREFMVKRLTTAHARLDASPQTDLAEQKPEVKIISIKEPESEAPILDFLGSSFLVPLIVGSDQRVAGVLLVGTEKKRHYSLDKIQFLYKVADQASACIHRLEQRLDEEKSQLIGIIENLPHGIIILDENHRILMMNSNAVLPLTFLSQARPGDTLTHLGQRPLSEYLTKTIKGQWMEEIRVGENESKVFEVIGRDLVTGPFTGGLLIALRDITDETSFTERVQQQERLAAVGQLAAGIAHDFNNLLTSIGGYSEMIAADEQTAPEVRERAEVIRTQVRRAAQLIRQILDFSRKSLSARHPLELISFIKESKKLLERTIRENVRIDMNYQAGEYMILADPVGLQQVITNLAINAQDAMPNGGILSIKLSRLTLGPRDTKPLPDMPQGEFVKIIVSDTGEGIPPGVLARIFNPFFTTKPKGKGTGLGLSQAMGIVHTHDGFIEVESRQDVGTTFRIYLPVFAASQGASRTVPAPALEKGSREVILLVEDEGEVCMMGRKMLERLGYRVITARDGRQALELYLENKQQVDLVLTDLVMPNMGGKELIKAIKSIDPAARIIVWTGYPLEDEDKALEQDIAGWVMKPPDIPELARKIKQAIQSSLAGQE